MCSLQGYRRTQGRRFYLSKLALSTYIMIFACRPVYDTLVASKMLSPPRSRSRFQESSGQPSTGIHTPCMRFNRHHSCFAHCLDSPQRGLNGREAFWARGKVLGGSRCVSPLVLLTLHCFIRHPPPSSSTNALIYHRCSPSGEPRPYTPWISLTRV